ncbi:TetR/AcrR family transcriptional regulator [Alcanivorax sp.]|uniref:TetR/AcrR family transcriptional regulator n=1 Tax=Alcanivorax sp. TaxID=1872427 RepID=UPI0025BDEFB9|nr:TetR/AcrR family transcriptional regulator [Alcanivorax sp.]
MPRPMRYDRQECLEKAMALFWERGYHATSMKDLELVLDMRPGSIYAAFGSKEALYGEALSLYASGMAGEFSRRVSSENGVIDGLASYVREMGKLNRDKLPSCACMLVKGLLETGESDTLQQQIEDSLAGMEGLFRQAFQQALEGKELARGGGERYQPERLARWLQCSIMGLRAYAQRSGDRRALQALADDLADDVVRLKA